MTTNQPEERMFPLMNPGALHAQVELMAQARSPRSDGSGPLTSESRMPCPLCSRERHTRLFRSPAGQPIWLWAQCICFEEREEAARRLEGEKAAAQEAAKAAAQQREMRRLLSECGMDLVDAFTLASFNPSYLTAPAGAHPYELGVSWLNEILEAGDQGSYVAGPPLALWFYSPKYGRGKTHLAAGLLWEAQRLGKLSVFVHETAFLSQRWACQLSDVPQLMALPTKQSFLTVVDDLGKAKPSESVKAVWAEFFNNRYLSRRWTIITSNYTPDELVRRGTIDESTESRLYGLIGGAVIEFNGSDIRTIQRGAV